MHLINNPKHRQPWNAEEIDLLCSYLSVRKPVREIARELGRSQEAVATKARQIGSFEAATL